MKRFGTISLTVLVALAVLSTSPSALAAQQQETPGSAVETFGERTTGVFNREAALLQRQKRHERLVSEMLTESLELPISVAVTQDERAQIEKNGEGERPVRVGLTKSVGKVISFADLTPPSLPKTVQLRQHGALRGTSDGGYVFTAVVKSEGATALRVHFTDFWLPEKAELYLFTLDGQVFGPYTGSGPDGDGEFWSHTVMGEQVVLQLRQHESVTIEDLQNTWFVIADVGHIGSKFVVGAVEQSGTHCSYNAQCVKNAECGVTNAAVTDARDAVAHMQWISGAFIYICSGGLLADTDSSSEIPYFLSANHCINKGKDARNLECFFQLTVACYTTDCDDIFDHMSNHPQSLRTLGATIKKTNKTGDFTLLELKEAAPNGSAFMGWNSTPVAFSNATALFRISHPGGAPQAYSEHEVNTSKPTCRSWPRGQRIYSHDLFGATEGGSSGSPVVNSAGQVVGQLSGACGYDPNDPCNAASNATVDGAFAHYFDQVSEFLDPSSCSPSSEVCDDGIDNDCDGDVDCADADCSGAPVCSSSTPTCGGHQSSCSSPDDCCSGNCKRGKCKGN